jgi:hypothetical protein
MLTSIAVASVFLTASPASAQQGTPAYNTIYYSDSTHQTTVGIISWTGCNRWGHPTYRLTGTQSPYWEEELVGYCGEGGMEPVS